MGNSDKKLHHNIDDDKLCYDFQKRYAALHSNDTNTHHNLYICKSVDMDGNITDIKYGMNTLTDWGLFLIMSDKEHIKVNIDGSIIDTTGNTKYKLDGSVQGDDSMLVMGPGIDSGYPNSPNPTKTSFDNIFGTNRSFVITDRYNFSNDDAYQDFTNGVITSTCKLMKGYYDYQVYDTNNVKYANTVNLERIGIITSLLNAWYQHPGYLLSTYSYIYDEMGRRSSIDKKPNEKLYVTVYATMVMDPEIHDRLYAKDIYSAFSPISFLKIISHRNEVNYGNVSNALTVNFGNSDGWYSDPSSFPLIKKDNVTGTMISGHFQNANINGINQPVSVANWNELTVDERLDYWYDHPEEWDYWATPKLPENRSEVDVSTTVYPFLLDENIIARVTGNSDINALSKLVENNNEFISHVTYADENMYSIQGYSGEEPYVLHFMMWTFPKLTEPETIITDLLWTKSPYYSNIDMATCGTVPNLTTGLGILPVADYSIQSLKRYNYITHTWDIDVPFYQPGNWTYDNYHFNKSVGIRIMGEGLTEPIPAMIYINCGKHIVNGVTYPGFADIIKFDNDSIVSIFGTDTYWDPSTWIRLNHNSIESSLTVTPINLLIKTVDGQPNPLIGQTHNMRRKKYYVLINPTNNNFSVTGSRDRLYGFAAGSYGTKTPLNPVFDAQIGSISETDKFIYTLPGDTDTLSDLVYTGRSIKYDSYRNPDVFGTQRAIKILCNDDTMNGSPMWSTFARCVVYYDNNLNPTNVYELVPDLPNTSDDWYSNTNTMSGEARWKFKNRILVAQLGCLGQMMMFDLHDSTSAPTAVHLDMHRHRMSNDYCDHFGFDNGGRYVTHFILSTVNNIRLVNNYETSWVIDIGDPDDPNGFCDTTYYEFPSAQFIVPIVNTSKMIARFGGKTDHGKTLTIFDMDKYKQKRIELIDGRSDLTEEELLEIHNQAISDESVVERTIEIPMESTYTETASPICCVMGFNDNVYIHFNDGNTNFIWHYSIMGNTLSNLLDLDVSLRNHFIFEQIPYYYQPVYYWSCSYSGFTTKYHCGNTSGITGNGVFVLSLYDQGEYDSAGKHFWIIKESDPGNIIGMSHISNNSTNSGYDVPSINTCTFDLKLVNDKELVLFTQHRDNRYSDRCHYTRIACWDLGLWLDDPTNTCVDRTVYDRDRSNNMCCIANGDRFETRCVGNTIMGTYMLTLNMQQNRIEFLPIHRFLNMRCTGTTTTIQAYNNPKRLNVRHPMSLIYSNKGIVNCKKSWMSNSYHHSIKSWMGVPDITTIQENWTNHTWNEEKLRKFVACNAMTKEEFKTITGNDYD